jgi:GT2 family glycosyltransferase
VSFVNPVRNDAFRLERCLRSIKANVSVGSTVDIIVVDNGSTDDSAVVAKRAGATVLQIEDASVSELRNIGAAHTSADILAFVDADHEIAAGWIATAVHTLRTPGVVAAGCLCHAPIDGTWVQRVYGALRGVPQGTHDVEWLGSGNLAVRRAAFEAAGGFDTSLTTCEDVDLCNRLRATGARIVSNAQMKNVHFGDPATLWALFKGELWRGQDNLRVSLRTPLTWRGMPSVVIPIVDMLMIVVAALGGLAAIAGYRSGLTVVAVAALIVLSGAMLRVARWFVRERRFLPVTLLQALAVSFVYDLGRAVALVTRAPHRAARARTVPAQ